MDHISESAKIVIAVQAVHTACPLQCCRYRQLDFRVRIKLIQPFFFMYHIFVPLIAYDLAHC